jgi:hypothetical protein
MRKVQTGGGKFKVVDGGTASHCYYAESSEISESIVQAVSSHKYIKLH